MADSAPLSDIPRQRLGELIAQYSRSLVEDPLRCESLINELCGEYRREGFLLVSALKVGAAPALAAAAAGVGKAPVLLNLAKQMHEHLPLSEEACRWAVEAWAEALGISTGTARKTPTTPLPATTTTATLTPPSAEQRRIAAAQFARANTVIKSGDFDYAIQLLLACCKLDPANLVYRQALRRTEKTKFKNNLKGSTLAKLGNPATWAKIKAAKVSRDYLKILELGEDVLTRNPWDTQAQLDMAEAAAALGLLDMGIWILEQARQKDAEVAVVNRALARLYEKRGNLSQAIALWELVSQADRTDAEATQKARDLAANSTIRKGNYEEVAAGKDPTAVGSTFHSVADRLTRDTAPLLEKLKKQPTNPDVYMQLSQLYRRAEQLEQARAILEQGLGPCGNHFSLTFALADLGLEPFRRDLALAEERLREDPDNEDLRRTRLRQLKEINARELEMYRQKSDRFPTESSYRLELGVRLLRAGQVEEAIRELQTARNDPRAAWRALMFLGHCFKLRQNWRLAQRNFEDALRGLPANDETNRKEILFQLAQGHAEAGDLATAMERGHELANLDYSYRDIGRLLDEWQERLQQA